MTVKKLIGWGLISAPFVALFIYITIESSLMVALGIFASVAVLEAVITLGFVLTYSKKE